MVLSVWSVVAVDEVLWTMISGSWRREEERGGERGQEGRKERRDREKGEKRRERRGGEARRGEERRG